MLATCMMNLVIKVNINIDNFVNILISMFNYMYMHDEMVSMACMSLDWLPIVKLKFYRQMLKFISHMFGLLKIIVSIERKMHTCTCGINNNCFEYVSCCT